MPSFSGLNQKDWIRACKKLGLEVSTKHGKGSHCRVYHPKNGRPLTIQNKLHKYISIEIYKVLLGWGFSEEEIQDALN